MSSTEKGNGYIDHSQRFPGPFAYVTRAPHTVSSGYTSTKLKRPLVFKYAQMVPCRIK
jgi:hypothetical protein